MKWFTSDWHLGHRSVIPLGGRPFTSIQHMREELVERACSLMKRGDLLYMLGDVCWKTDEAIPALQALKKHGIELHLIEGNHDHRLNATAKKQYFTTVHSGFRVLHEEGGVRISLSHHPMLSWDRSFANAWLLYGHIHRGSGEKEFIEQILKGKALNVNVEFHDYKPWSLDEIIEYMNQRPSNMDADAFYEQRRREDLKREFLQQETTQQTRLGGKI